MNHSPTRVLISGFKPFGSSKLNPSELLVNELVKEEIPGVHLDSIVLPVEFDSSTTLMLEKIASSKPDVVISFGQAEGRKAITPEKIAVNFDNAQIPDNSGDQRQSRFIDSKGADGYFTTLNIEKMIESIKDLGIPAELSMSAGAFVCNHLFYQLQKALKGSEIKSGFVHIPLVTEQAIEFPGQPTMELKDLVRAARAAILSTL
jgi:pyroglutamyl-peptidase